MIEDIPMIPVSSSMIESVGRDDENGVTRIRFKDKQGIPTRTYDYEASAEDHVALMSAPSMGRYFLQVWKNKYAGVEV